MFYRSVFALVVLTTFTLPSFGAPRRSRSSSARPASVVAKLAAAAQTSASASGTSVTVSKATVTPSAGAKGSASAASGGSKKDDATTNSLLEEIKAADSKSSTATGDKAVVVTLSGEIKERGDTVVLFGKQAKSLKSYLDLIRRAREDKQVKTIVIRLSSAELGMGMAQELRAAIKEARDKGKKTVAILEDDSQASYMVALACEELVLPPSADLMIYGVKADAYFLRSLLSKVGVNVQIVHVGQYKSYGEMFTNDDFTTPARQNMTEIVDDMYSQMVNTISSDRKITTAAAEAALERGPVSAEEAKQAKLVDRVEYAEEVLAQLKKDGGDVVDMNDYSKDASAKADDISLFSLFSMMSKSNKASSSASDTTTKYPQVAVVYAVGPISLGSNEGVGINSEDEIAAQDLIQVLDDVKKEDKVKAVILRVNSPGGSAFASDLIWKKLEEVKRVKPVIASMSDVAASGGYYISMGATKIIAEPGTITGSIGVVGGKPNLKGLYDKIGVNKTSITKGQYAELFSETSNFSDKELELIEKMMNRTYKEFVTKAAQGRKMPYEKVHEVAQGRVWTGERAKTVGLVDELGGMGTAITEAKQLIGLKKDDKVSLVSYPKELTLFDYIQKAISGNVVARVETPSITTSIVNSEMLPVGLQTVLKSAMSIGRMFQHERVLAVMPYMPQIK